MVTYQTQIQNPKDIRFGSAKIEIYDDDAAAWRNLGAVKSVSATTTTNGTQKFKPDNAPPITIDPVPETWDWNFELQEGWKVETLKLLRGSIDTFATTSAGTTIGVYAGTGARPRRKIRITNTTAGQDAVVITLLQAVLTSELDWTFPTDEDGTTAVALPVTVSAELAGVSGFGTVFIPVNSGTVTISPESVSVAPAGTQTMTVTGATVVTYGTADVGVATVSAAGVVTGVADGTTQLIVTADNIPHYIPVVVTTE